MAFPFIDPSCPPPEFEPPSSGSLPPLTHEEEAWSRILAAQVASIHAHAPALSGFMDAHFTPPLIDYLGRRAEAEMTATLADQSPRCFTFRQVDAWHVVLTTPVRKDAARDWFAKNYGSYLAFVEPYWSYWPHGRRGGGGMGPVNWAVLCQTTFGAPGWVEVAIVPARWCPELPAAWPEEFLTDDDLRTMSLP